MTFAVRPARNDDAAEAIQAVHGSITQLCAVDHQGDHATLARWLDNKTTDHFIEWLANPDNFCVVAESGRLISGVGLLHRSGNLRLFYIAPGAQRQGIGRQIHAILERQAGRWGLTTLRLDSTTLARSFYEALGYRSAGSAKAMFGVLWCFPYEKSLQRALPAGPSAIPAPA